MSGTGHIGAHEVEQPVVIDIGCVGAHGVPRRVGQHFSGHVAERTVTMVEIKMIGAPKIVGYVEIRPAIVVKVPPGCG